MSVYKPNKQHFELHEVYQNIIIHSWLYHQFLFTASICDLLSIKGLYKNDYSTPWFNDLKLSAFIITHKIHYTLFKVFFIMLILILTSNVQCSCLTTAPITVEHSNSFSCQEKINTCNQDYKDHWDVASPALQTLLFNSLRFLHWGHSKAPPPHCLSEPRNVANLI